MVLQVVPVVCSAMGSACEEIRGAASQFLSHLATSCSTGMEGLAMVDLLLASEGGGDPFAAANANAVLEALHGEACRTETCAQVGKLADEGSAEG